MYHVVLCNSLDPEISPICLTGCECQEVGKLVCTGLTGIAQIQNRSMIHSLSINSHNITELKSGDFANFTKLELLDLSDGMIVSIAPGTFDDVRDTIVRISLQKNRLNKLNKGVFNDLKHINEISLDSNHLGKLNEECFVNLPELETLLIRANHIDMIAEGAFKDLPKLENLNLYNNYLPEIPADALNSLLSLLDLTLSFNHIDKISESINLLLPNLENIHLDSNPFGTITTFPKVSNSLKTLNLQFSFMSNFGKDTWKNVQSIEMLYISGTMLKSAHEGMFEGLVNLERIFMRDMPVLESIGPNTFKGLTKLHSLDVASSPKLKHIAENALQSTNVTSFFAYDCKLPNVPERLLPWPQMKVVMVKENPIHCDCDVKWMLNETIFGNNSDVKSSFDLLKCASPSTLKDTKVTSTHPDRLICHHDDHTRRLATGIIVVIVCAIFMLTFAVIMKFRKRILSSCRRYYQYRRYQNDMVFTVEHDTSVAELEDGDQMDGRPLKEMRLETVPLEM